MSGMGPAAVSSQMGDVLIGGSLYQCYPERTFLSNCFQRTGEYKEVIREKSRKNIGPGGHREHFFT